MRSLLRVYRKKFIEFIAKFIESFLRKVYREKLTESILRKVKL